MTKHQAPDFQQIAKELDLDAEELRKGYEALQRSRQQGLPQITTNRDPAVADGGSCITETFSVSFLEIVSVEGTVKHCVGECWTAELDLKIKLLGVTVATPRLQLDCRTAEVCLDVNALIARARLCLGIRGSRLCFYINGEACFWDLIRGWVCERFDETLFCLAADGESSRTALAGADGGCGCRK
jgi:hypothetical protein